MLKVTKAEYEEMLAMLDSSSETSLLSLDKMIRKLEEEDTLQKTRDDLIEFCKKMQPDYKVGRHHRILADQLMALEDGSKDRVCVNIPPRHGKSQLGKYILSCLVPWTEPRKEGDDGVTHHRPSGGLRAEGEKPDRYRVI